MLKKFTKLLLGAAMVSLWAASSAVPASAEGVGRVKLVKEWAYERLQPGDWDDLYLEDEVFSNQRIRTPPNAAVHLHFVDGADFRIGASSEIVIDKYVFDPSSKSKGKIVATLGKGVFRFISGQVKDYEIKTPSATIGIRGTDIIVAVLDNQNTVMQVNSGAATMMPCSRGAGNRFECAPGAQAVIAVGETAGVAFGSNVVQPGVPVPQDPGLDDDGGLAALDPQGGGPSRFNTNFGGNNQEFTDLCESDPGHPVCTSEPIDSTSPFD